MNSRTSNYYARLAGHKISIVAMLIPFGLVVFITALNESFILQYSEGSYESIMTVQVMIYGGVATVIGAILWIILILIARRTRLPFGRGL